MAAKLPWAELLPRTFGFAIFPGPAYKVFLYRHAS
jgi:hypothetical protein